jgi:hypothetical protein
MMVTNPRGLNILFGIIQPYRFVTCTQTDDFEQFKLQKKEVVKPKELGRSQEKHANGKDVDHRHKGK